MENVSACTINRQLDTVEKCMYVYLQEVLPLSFFLASLDIGPVVFRY